MLQAAARIVNGELPYRDFYANYGPGQYYLVGALDFVFGPSLLTWRIVRVALDALVAVLAYALVRREGSEPLALLAWVAVLFAMAHPTLPHPNAAALALAFGAILLARRSPVAAGVLAGVAFAFRFDLGAAAAVGAALAAAAAARSPLRVLLAALVTGAVLVLPFVVAAPGDFWDDTFGFALDEQSLQRLPLPGGWDGGFEPNKILAFYMPWVLIGGLALWGVAAAALRPPLRIWAALPVALAGLAYLLARRGRVPPRAAGRRAPGTARRHRPARAAGRVHPRPRAPRRADRAQRDRPEPHRPDRSRAAATDPRRRGGRREGSARRGARARATVAYIRRAVPPGRPIFVANPRHDLVRVGNPLLYVLADRENPTRYDVMQPGVVTTAPRAARDRARPAPLTHRARGPLAQPRGRRARAQRGWPLQRGAGARPLPRGRLQARCPVRRLPGPAPRRGPVRNEIVTTTAAHTSWSTNRASATRSRFAPIDASRTTSTTAATASAQMNRARWRPSRYWTDR